MRNRPALGRLTKDDLRQLPMEEAESIVNRVEACQELSQD